MWGSRFSATGLKSVYEKDLLHWMDRVSLEESEWSRVVSPVGEVIEKKMKTFVREVIVEQVRNCTGLGKDIKEMIVTRVVESLWKRG